MKPFKQTNCPEKKTEDQEEPNFPPNEPPYSPPKEPPTIIPPEEIPEYPPDIPEPGDPEVPINHEIHIGIVNFPFKIKTN